MQRYRRVILVALVLLLLSFSVVSFSVVSAESPIIHVVGWGDTLFSIAARYGTTVNAVMQTNGIKNADFIYVGQRLVISGGSPVPPINGSTYTVQSGDTLFSIATRNGTTVSALMQANGLYNYWIYVGQVLKIPGAFPVPVPQPAPIPQQGIYHIVRPGEYLALIASRYGSSVYTIQMANKMPNASFIWSGERLFIPGAQPLVNPVPIFNPLPPVYVPPSNPIVVVQPTAPAPGPIPVIILPTPVSPAPIPNPYSGVWEAVLITNTVGTGPCFLDVNVIGKSNWPVVVATPDGSWISDPKLTGTKPELGPYYVEFAHACTGVWRVIPLGLNTYADVQLKGGHATIEFHQRP